MSMQFGDGNITLPKSFTVSQNIFKLATPQKIEGGTTLKAIVKKHVKKGGNNKDTHILSRKDE